MRTRKEVGEKVKTSCNAQPQPPCKEAGEDEMDGTTAQLSNDRLKRLETLVEQLRRGEYSPDFDALSRALLEKEPELFGLPARGKDAFKRQG